MRGAKISFGFNPFGNIMYFLTGTAGTTISVYITIILGSTINEIQGMIGGNNSLSEIIYPIVLLGVLSVLLWILIEIRWRFSEDILPLKSRIRAQKKIIGISQNIPVREFDREDFNTEYSKFADGYNDLCSFLPSLTGFINMAYRLILSSVILFQMHFSFPIIILVFLVMWFALNKNYADVFNELWGKIHRISRKSDYLAKQFSGTSNRDTRLLNLEDKFVTDWLEISRTVANLNAEGRKKTDKPFAVYISFCQNIAELAAIAICLYLIGNGALQIGAIYIVWNLINNVV
jgi:ABC-type multidrug transport system fused ATPase/permease subunit